MIKRFRKKKVYFSGPPRSGLPRRTVDGATGRVQAARPHLQRQFEGRHRGARIRICVLLQIQKLFFFSLALSTEKIWKMSHSWNMFSIRKNKVLNIYIFRFEWTANASTLWTRWSGRCPSCFGQKPATSPKWRGRSWSKRERNRRNAEAISSSKAARRWRLFNTKRYIEYQGRFNTMLYRAIRISFWFWRFLCFWNMLSTARIRVLNESKIFGPTRKVWAGPL